MFYNSIEFQSLCVVPFATFCLNLLVLLLSAYTMYHVRAIISVALVLYPTVHDQITLITFTCVRTFKWP